MGKAELLIRINILFENMLHQTDIENLLITYGKLLGYIEVLSYSYAGNAKIKEKVDTAMKDKYIELSCDI